MLQFPLRLINKKVNKQKVYFDFKNSLNDMSSLNRFVQNIFICNSILLKKRLSAVVNTFCSSSPIWKMDTSASISTNSNLSPQLSVSKEILKDNEPIEYSGEEKVDKQAIQEKSKPKTLSKRAIKRQARAQLYKEEKKKRRALQTVNEAAGFSLAEIEEGSGYFENGLRKVYPYHYAFVTYAKERWYGRTLKSVLEAEFGFDHPDDLEKTFDRGKISVNNVRVSKDYVLKDNDHISHQVHRHENPVTGSRIEVIEDTEEVLVINKPSSIPCHPCGRYRFNSIPFILGKEMGYYNLRNLYRLDRLTSGVLVLGKTNATTKRFTDQIVNRQVLKEYVCRVEGEFPSETVKVDQPLEKLSNKLRLMVISPTGKPSQTTFTRLSYNGRSSVVKCVPHTGRTHQIRVHLQYLGHPIINDVFYNSDAWGPNKAKGGVYEVSHSVVCTRILKKHSITQWDGGESTLFNQKLKEMKAAECNGSPQAQTKEVSATEDEKKDLGAKLEKIEQCDSTSLQPSDISANLDINVDNMSTVCEKTGNPESSNCSSDAIRHIEFDLKNCEPVISQTKEGPQGFDWMKYKVDPTCDLCRKTFLDPKPKDLVMFLHALKYKGQGWEYQTKLPDWACENWAEEDQFLIESTIESEET